MRGAECVGLAEKGDHPCWTGQAAPCAREVAKCLDESKPVMLLKTAFPYNVHMPGNGSDYLSEADVAIMVGIKVPAPEVMDLDLQEVQASPPWFAHRRRGHAHRRRRNTNHILSKAAPVRPGNVKASMSSKRRVHYSEPVACVKDVEEGYQAVSTVRGRTVVCAERIKNSSFPDDALDFRCAAAAAVPTTFHVGDKRASRMFSAPFAIKAAVVVAGPWLRLRLRPWIRGSASRTIGSQGQTHTSAQATLPLAKKRTMRGRGMAAKAAGRQIRSNGCSRTGQSPDLEACHVVHRILLLATPRNTLKVQVPSLRRTPPSARTDLFKPS